MRNFLLNGPDGKCPRSFFWNGCGRRQLQGTVRGGANAEVKFADFFEAGPNGLIKKRRAYF
jgi:hypothetical protein